jgi:hypothetical protein
VTGAFPIAIIGEGAGAIIGAGAGAISIIGAGAGAIIGPGAMAGEGAGAIMTILAGAPESMTLGLAVTRVSRPTPTSALSTGRGDPVTFGSLL